MVVEVGEIVSLVSGACLLVKAGYNVYSIIPGFKELKESVDDYLNYLSAFQKELANLESTEDSIQEPLRLLKEQVETSLSPFSEWQEKSDGHKLWTSTSVKREMGRSEKQINRYLNIFFCTALGRRNEKQITGKTEELKDNHLETMGREESLELKKPKEMEKRKPRLPPWKRIVYKSWESWRSFLCKRTKKKTELKNIHHEMVTDTSQKIQEQKKQITGKTEELKDNHHETVGREESLELKKPKEMEKRKPRLPPWKRIVSKPYKRCRSFLCKRTKKKTELKNIHHEMVTDTSQKIQEQKRYVEEYKQLLKQVFTLDWVTTHLGDGKEALKSWDEAVPLLQKHRRFQRLSENLRQVTWLNHVERLRVKVPKQEKDKNKPAGRRKSKASHISQEMSTVGLRKQVARGKKTDNKEMPTVGLRKQVAGEMPTVGLRKQVAGGKKTDNKD